MRVIRAGKLLLMLLLCVLTLFMGSGKADALMFKMSLEDLTDGADSIVVGTVVRTSSQWNHEVTSIYTEVVVSVEEYVKGADHNQEITILVPGGEADGIIEVVSVMPVFTVGEQVMLFLKDAARTSQIGQNQLQFTTPVFTVHGNFQGKLEVIENKVEDMSIREFESQISSIMRGDSRIIETASAEQIFVDQSPYVFNGQKWFGDWPVVDFKANTEGSPTGSLTAVQNAAATWSNAGAKFTFMYDGPHYRNGIYEHNLINEITWYNLGAGPTLAYASWRYYSTGEIFEADMVFNTYYNWSTATPTPAGYFDVETVALHEFGHWLSLGHSTASDSVMWWQYVKPHRTLYAGDIAGITYLYGLADEVLPRPTLLSPEDGVDMTSPSVAFQWDTVLGASEYWLRVQRVSDGAEIVDKNLGNVTTYTQGDFPNDGATYTWSVRAGNNSGWSEYAPVRSFVSVQPLTITSTRIAGSNRYATAVEVSKAGWSGGAATVLLARGDDYADALAGVPLAYRLDAPILLTRTDVLTSETAAEIERLGAARVIILGGEAAISHGVKLELEGNGFMVERIAGMNRYATAALIAHRLKEEGVQFSAAFIAVGTNFADALAASSYAAVLGQPILLTSAKALSPATADAINAFGLTQTIVCGGEAAVSKDVVDMLPNPLRIAGVNRYATAVALAEVFLLPETKQISIATGLNFPDAIAGGVLAAKMNHGVLLVRGDRSEPDPVVQDILADRQISAVTLFGGSGAISDDMAAWFEGNLGNR